MELNKRFILNPNSLIVTGHTRTLLFDVDRSSYCLLPNILAVILGDKSVRSIDDVIVKYSKCDDDSEQIFKYFEYLIKLDLIIFTEAFDLYSSFEPEYYYPGYISNAIVDIDEFHLYEARKFINELDSLLCRAIQLRFYGKFDLNAIEEFVGIFYNSIFEWIEIILEEPVVLNVDKWVELNTAEPRIKNIVFYNCNKSEMIYLSEVNEFKIVGVTNTMESNKCCGVIGEHYFAPNIVSVSEAYSNNSCLNLKISMDVEGNIKNCPSMVESYGNIRNTELDKVLENPSFKKLWSITKDKIHVCKNCEFRYICTDCRAFIEDPADILSKPLKCGYNPYIGEWSEWSANPLKQKAIAYYDMEELVVERQKKIKVDQAAV